MARLGQHPRTPLSLATAALLLELSGCSSSAPAPKAAPPPDTGDVATFLPLVDDTVFAYQTRDESTGEQGILVLEVKRPRPGYVELNVAGRVRRLDVSPTEIRYATGGTVLAKPLRLGAKWAGQDGPVEVTQVGMNVRVPAGSFSGCIETQESGESPMGVQKRISTVYCPEVGIVRLEVEGVSGQEVLHEVAELQSHGPRVRLGE